MAMTEPRQVKAAFSFKHGTDTYAWLCAYADQAHGGNKSAALSYLIEYFRTTHPQLRSLARKAKEGTAQHT